MVLINKSRDMKLFQLQVKDYELKKLCEVYIFIVYLTMWSLVQFIQHCMSE